MAGLLTNAGLDKTNIIDFRVVKELLAGVLISVSPGPESYMTFVNLLGWWA